MSDVAKEVTMNWYDGTGIPLPMQHLWRLENMIRDALAAERERCAKVAESIRTIAMFDGPSAQRLHEQQVGSNHAAMLIAEKIRKGTT
jgi:hypothetical protein